jgi:YD repeat-containing protein
MMERAERSQIRRSPLQRHWQRLPRGLGVLSWVKALIVPLITAVGQPIWAQSTDPIPSFYQEPGLSENREYVTQHFAEAVDPFTGKLQLHYVDLSLQGNGGLDIKVQRSYTAPDWYSAALPASSIGLGWTMHYGIYYGSCGNNVNSPMEMPDGSRKIFYTALDGVSMVSKDRWKASCAPGATAGMTVFSPDGTRYDMTTPGNVVAANSPMEWQVYYTTQITDRNGNTLNFSYVPTISSADATQLGVSTIVASDGRQVNFSYQGGMLTQVADGHGHSVNYAYQADSSLATFNQFLQTVTLASQGGAWQYQYMLGQWAGDAPGIGALTQLTYPGGGTLSYKYGFVVFHTLLPQSTVVTQKTDAANQMWQYAYTPATQQCTENADGTCTFTAASMDLTTITMPDGTVEEYQHIGANGVQSGYVWAMGLPTSHSTGVVSGRAEEIVTFGWVPQGISNSPDHRGGFLAIDGVTAAALMSDKTVNRNAQVYDTRYGNFDAYGNAQTLVDTGPSGAGGTQNRTTSLTYAVDPTKWLLRLVQQSVVSNAGTIARIFDPKGNIQSETKYGVATGFTYTSAGDVQSRADGDGNTVTFSGYSFGVPQLESYPEGVSVTRVVDTTGNVRSQTDATGATTAYTYDDLNRIVAIQHPVGNPVTVGWTPNSRVITRGAYSERTTLDGYGRTASVTHTDSGSGQSIVQNYLYDTLGRQTFASYPNSAQGVRTWYDALNRPYYDEPAVQPADPVTTVAVSSAFIANTEVITDENGNQTTKLYGAWGDADRLLLMQTQPPDPSATVTVVRNGIGQPLTVSQGGKQRSYNYDPHFFLLGVQDTGMPVITYQRDAIGNMLSRAIAGATTAYKYDGRNRLTTVTYPDATPTVTRAYYTDDRLRTATTSVATRTFNYDKNKNLTSEQLAIGGATMTAGYGYDANDALASITYGSLRQVNYAPDAFGRPTHAIPYVSKVEHAPNGSISHLVFANGVDTQMQQNPRLWPGSITTVLGGTSISNLSYHYDNVGNPLSVGDAAYLAAARTFQYDGMNRVKVANQAGLTGSLSYDGRGNILSNLSQIDSLGTHSLSYSYDPSTDLLTNVSDTVGVTTTPYAITHDASGNMTTKGAMTFQYDAENRMTCANCAASATTYAYDGLGNRVFSTYGGKTTYFMYSHAGELLWQQDPSTVTEFAYVAGRQVAVHVASP